MGKTYLHKAKGRFNSGKDSYEDIPRKLKNHFNRHDSERGKFKDRKNKLKLERFNEDE